MVWLLDQFRLSACQSLKGFHLLLFIQNSTQQVIQKHFVSGCFNKMLYFNEFFVFLWIYLHHRHVNISVSQSLISLRYQDSFDSKCPVNRLRSRYVIGDFTKVNIKVKESCLITDMCWLLVHQRRRYKTILTF